MTNTMVAYFQLLNSEFYEMYFRCYVIRSTAHMNIDSELYDDTGLFDDGSCVVCYYDTFIVEEFNGFVKLLIISQIKRNINVF